MLIIHLDESLQGLQRVSEEISSKELLGTKAFSCGLISFMPIRRTDEKQITHSDKDVLCHVLEGHGRLRMNKEEIPIRAGTVCHIPAGTPHDFAAVGGEMVIFYSLITTGRNEE